MKKYFKISALVALAMALVTPVFTACSDDDDFNTNQFVGGVHLNSFGPSPVARGGELRFIGSGMNQIIKINIPGCGDITDIEVISNEEIRVTVPQTAEPGYVTLYYANGEIVTKTVLTYSEPISIDTIAPAKVKPGQELTITGDYLNLINEVSFAFINDSVNVFAKDFTAHDRKQIKLVVPEEAVSGIIIISDAKAVPNTMKSETEIEVTLPSVDKTTDLTNAKGGDIITIAGNDFDLVRVVELPNGDKADFVYSNGAIKFTLPENISDGSVVVIPASGVRVAVATVGVVVPTELVATPAEGLRGGDQLTISGLNLDQTSSVSFPGVDDAVEPTSVENSKLVVAWPDAATSGDVVLNLRSGKSVSVAVATAKPEVLSMDPNPVSAASELTLKGKNLDLISSITFGGNVKLAVTPSSAAELTVTCPATATSGALTLTMANGETVTTSELTVNSPECCFITGVVTEELKAGEIMQVTVKNGDKLQSVTVKGENVQFIRNGENLFINLPTSCGKKTEIILVSSNGQISYTYDVTPATHVSIMAYSGPARDLGSWAGEGDGGAFRIYKDVFDGVPAGATLTFHMAAYADCQIQINDANWGQMEMLKLPNGTTTAEFELTAERLERILGTNDGWSNTALVIQGEKAVISTVTIEYEQSLEQVIYQGPVTLTWGDDGRFGLPLNVFEECKAGSQLIIYFSKTANWGQAQLNNGWWANGNMNFPEIGGAYLTSDNCGSGDSISLTLTQSILDDIIASPGDYWGLNTNYHNGDTRVGMVIQGSDFIINKVAILAK